MNKALLPMPIHTAVLLLTWLLLNDFSIGHLLLGSLLAVLIPWLVAPLSDPQAPVRKPGKALVYALIVLWDILRSNIEVAILVMRPNRSLRPALLALPLDIQGDLPQALLASTISLTPGTVSMDFSEDRRWLYIHALHVTDEQALLRSIKERYEAPLKEIFAC
ncbi:Na+/H+ antiporter subunit E [Parathalassolituus penaei]|uniref:Na+/H+ antiporter subunit E n=1 Tax=Parathalassolituus penaei TaxID=2997323 RepID=A0A9X3ITC6_9GAMM|nr:Na+/H+ antiporter subunit E [Parathalassolituus penaei]MCY0967357.1 Na+/H+ antiporter subunit E [Parathalassolituus penaei]